MEVKASMMILLPDEDVRISLVTFRFGSLLWNTEQETVSEGSLFLVIACDHYCPEGE